MHFTLAPIGEDWSAATLVHNRVGFWNGVPYPHWLKSTWITEHRRKTLAKGFHPKSRELRGFSIAKQLPDTLQASTIRLVA